jgi:hypothetical protein
LESPLSKANLKLIGKQGNADTNRIYGQNLPLLCYGRLVDMIEELDGGGVLDESDPLYDTIAAMAIDAISAET